MCSEGIGSVTRVLALWSPDWPVTAAAIAGRVPAHRPAAVVVAGRVLACSAVARSHGVRRGLRKREAQARCPELAVLDHDADRDARLFEPVVVAIEELAPGVEIVRPGLVALPAQGPVGWFGGEQAAAEALVDQVAARTGVECQVGVADGLFAAMLAARRGLAVAPGDTPAFLAPLGVEELDREPEVDRGELVGLLRRLGLRSLGAFAALDPADVGSRFGADAVLCHRLARGLDPRPPLRRTPPEELTVEVELDPPVDRVDAAAFAARGLAEHLHQRLAAHGLSCTRLGVVADTVGGERLHRIWRCAEPLTPAGTVDRVRWQLDSWLTHRRSASAALARAAVSDGELASSLAYRRSASAALARAAVSDGELASSLAYRRSASAAFARAAVSDGELASSASDGEPASSGGSAAVARLRLVPEETVTAGALQLGLWGDIGEADERAGRALVRVQALLGPESVVTAVLVGGRDPAEQVRLVPWGDSRDLGLPVLPTPPNHGSRGTAARPDASPRTTGSATSTASAPGAGPPRSSATAARRVDMAAGEKGAESGERRPPEVAPAGWPDDVLRSTGRLAPASATKRPTNRRRRVPTPRRSTGGAAVRDPAPSWPGRLPAPSPATVPPQPLPAELRDAAGAPVRLSAPDVLSAPPHEVVVDGGSPRAVRAWAGPWPLQQRWWTPDAVAGSRLQVATADGEALLLLVSEGRWWVTGVYD
jgi:protein ImuB